jgi:hypothetical protein
VVGARLECAKVHIERGESSAAAGGDAVPARVTSGGSRERHFSKSNEQPVHVTALGMEVERHACEGASLQIGS